MSSWLIDWDITMENFWGHFIAIHAQFLRTFRNYFLSLAIEIDSWELYLTLLYSSPHRSWFSHPMLKDRRRSHAQSIEQLMTKLGKERLLGDEVPDDGSHKDV